MCVLDCLEPCVRVNACVGAVCDCVTGRLCDGVCPCQHVGSTSWPCVCACADVRIAARAPPLSQTTVKSTVAGLRAHFAKLLTMKPLTGDDALDVRVLDAVLTEAALAAKDGSDDGSFFLRQLKSHTAFDSKAAAKGKKAVKSRCVVWWSCS